MKRLPWPRRAPWLVLGLVLVAAFAAGVAVAASELHPADLTFTPKSEKQFTNIDVARAWAKNYYGAPGAVAGSGATATWDAPLNQHSNYANEAESVEKGWTTGSSRIRTSRTGRSCSTSTTRHSRPGTTSSTATGTSTGRRTPSSSA